MKFSTALAPRGSRPGGSGGGTRPVRRRSTAGARRRDLVHAARVPRRAAQQPPHRQRRALEQAVDLQGLDGVGAAGRVEAARRRQRRGDPALVAAHQKTSGRAPGRCGHDPGDVAHRLAHDRVPVLRRTARRPESRSSPRTDDGAPRPRRQRPDDQPGPGGRLARRGRDQVAQPPGDAVAHDRAADGPAHHETRPRRGVGGPGRRQAPSRWTTSRGRPTRRPRRTAEANSSRRVSREPAGSTGAAASGREPLAALAAASGEDGAPGPGAHPQPEAVRARPAAVVRLEGALALAHGRLSRSTARDEAGRRSAECALDGTCWSAMVLDGTRTGRDRRRTRFRPGYAAPRERVKPPRYSRSTATACHADRGERHPPVTPPHLAAQRRLVSGGPCRLACPLTARSGGILSPCGSRRAPRRDVARVRVPFAHRCGQVWGWMPPRPCRWMRRPPRQSRRTAKGVRTWPTSPASWRTCGTA